MVDVIVTDGFTGNVALKAIEGTARLIASLIKQSFRASWGMKIGAILCLPGVIVALPAVLALRKRVDPRSYNGAGLMGLRGLCIKSHGGTDAVGFAHAIGVAADMAFIRFNEKVAQELEKIGMKDLVSEASSEEESA